VYIIIIIIITQRIVVLLTDVSGQPISPTSKGKEIQEKKFFFLGTLDHEDGTDMLYRNVGKE